MDKPEIRTQDIDFGRRYSVTAEWDRSAFFEQMFIESVRQAAKLIAERFCAEHSQEIMAAMSPEAVANLAVANSGAEIAKELKKEAATTTRVVEHVTEHVKREIYQRGVFGGVKRIG